MNLTLLLCECQWADLIELRRWGLAMDLAHVVSEAIFDIAGLVEAAGHEGFDSILGGGSAERGDAGIPSGAYFDVGGQGGVDEALGVGNCPFVELGDPGCEGF